MTKYKLLALSDEELLRQCRFEACRGVGPGGQHRNKTSSAARVTHLESGISVRDDITRSQHKNLAHALRRLRAEIAVELPLPEGEMPPDDIPALPVPKENSPRYPLWLARLFDALRTNGFQPAPTAQQLGCTSTSQFLKILAKDDFAWQKFSETRQKLHLPTLHS